MRLSNLFKATTSLFLISLFPPVVASQIIDLSNLVTLYPEDFSSSGSTSSTRYFRYSLPFHPYDPFYDGTFKTFTTGIRYDILFQGALLHQNPSTGRILPSVLPTVSTGTMIRSGNQRPPRWDGSDISILPYSISAMKIANLPIPVSLPLNFTYSTTITQKYGRDSNSQSWVSDIDKILRLGNIRQTDFLVQVDAPTDHQFLAYPRVAKAEVTYESASLFFRTQIKRDFPVPGCKAFSACSADRIYISSGARTDSGQILNIEDAARLMGFDSFNFVSKIVRSNDALKPRAALPIESVAGAVIIQSYCRSLVWWLGLCGCRL